MVILDFRNDGAVTACKSVEVASIIVRRVILPATEEDADPFVGEGADGGMMRLSSIDLQAVIGLSPAAAADGASSKLMKSLTVEFGTAEAKEYFVGFSTSSGNRSNA